MLRRFFYAAAAFHGCTSSIRSATIERPGIGLADGQAAACFMHAASGFLEFVENTPEVLYKRSSPGIVILAPESFHV